MSGRATEKTQERSQKLKFLIILDITYESRRTQWSEQNTQSFVPIKERYGTGEQGFVVKLEF